MRRSELPHAYFNWMCGLVHDDIAFQHGTYSRLMHVLHEIDFNYIIPMDGDRAEDGCDLRYRFAYENALDGRTIASCLDIRPASVLEVMVALAVRCEESIMDDPDIGNRTGHWFWSMIDTLGLFNMTDDNFNELFVRKTIRKFLDRDYAPDGKGGLFCVPNIPDDMREIVIWYQMCHYINYINSLD